MPTLGKRNKIILLPEDVKFIHNNWKTMTNPELAKSLGLRLTKLRGFLSKMGLKRMEMEYWTHDQVTFLKANFKKMGDVEMSEFFEAEWPKNKKWTEKHIRKKRVYLNLQRTAKQVDSVRKRNVKAGRYNTVNQRWKTTGANAIGTIVFWRKQNSEVKFPLIKTENGYVHYYRWFYTQEHGTLNPNQLVVPKKEAPKNTLLEVTQLEVIDREEHARRNVAARMELPEELREIIKFTNKLSKTIKHQENETRN